MTQQPNIGLPPLGGFKQTVGDFAKDDYVLALLDIGGSYLSIEFVAVTTNEAGRVTGTKDPDFQERTDTVLLANDNRDPSTLEWAGRHWLVFSDPVGR